MTEQEKWEVVCDDSEFIELMKEQGETPESASGWTTEEIETYKAYLDERANKLGETNSSNLLCRYFVWSMLAIGVFNICKLIYKQLKRAKEMKHIENLENED